LIALQIVSLDGSTLGSNCRVSLHC